MSGPKLRRLEVNDMRNSSAGAQLRFAAPVPAEQLELLGERWGGWSGARELRKCWRFAGARAEVMFEPRGRVDVDALDALEHFLARVHAVAPISEGELFLGSGPPFEGAPEPAFERGVARALVAKGEAHVAELEAAVEKLGLDLEAVDGPDYAAQEDYPDWARRWVGQGRLAGSLARPELPPDELSPSGVGLAKGTSPRSSLAPGPAGALMGVLARGRSTVLLLDAGTPELVVEAAEADGLVTAVHWLDDEHALVLTAKRCMVLHRRGPGEWEEVASRKDTGVSMVIYEDGLVAIRKKYSLRAKGSPLVFLAWVNQELRRLGTLPARGLALHGTRSGPPCVSLRAPEGAGPPRHFLLVGVSERLAKERAKRTRQS